MKKKLVDWKNYDKNTFIYFILWLIIFILGLIIHNYTIETVKYSNITNFLESLAVPWVFLVLPGFFGYRFWYKILER